MERRGLSRRQLLEHAGALEAGYTVSTLSMDGRPNPVLKAMAKAGGGKFIATDDGVKVGGSYEATEEKIAETAGFISQNGEDAALRKQTFEESLGWYAGITADMFG